MIHSTKGVVRYLKFARHFNEQFPGFETDIHGLVKETENGKARYYVDCVCADGKNVSKE